MIRHSYLAHRRHKTIAHNQKESPVARSGSQADHTNAPRQPKQANKTGMAKYVPFYSDIHIRHYRKRLCIFHPTHLALSLGLHPFGWIHKRCCQQWITTKIVLTTLACDVKNKTTYCFWTMSPIMYLIVAVNRKSVHFRSNSVLSEFLYKTLERKKIKVWTLVRKLSRLNSYRNPAGDKEPIWKCLTKPPQRKEACFETKWRKTHTPTLTQIQEQFFGLQLLWWDQVWHEFRSGVRECFFLFLLQSPEDLLLAFRTFLHLQVFFFFALAQLIWWLCKLESAFLSPSFGLLYTDKSTWTLTH